LGLFALPSLFLLFGNEGVQRCHVKSPCSERLRRSWYQAGGGLGPDRPGFLAQNFLGMLDFAALSLR
jgi:hypothetical protein